MGGIQSNGRSDIPIRADREPAPPLSESKVVLYGTQGGNCNGCGTHFLASAFDGGPHHCAVEGRDWSSGQLAAVVWALQLVEGESSDGIFEGAVGAGVCVSNLWVICTAT